MARKCEVLLRGEFSLFPFKNSVYDVEVTQKWISYENARNGYDDKHYILFGDVTGCRCRKSRTYDVSSCFLTVYHYPICIKSNRGKRSREKQTVTFDIHSSDNFEENLRICQRWRNVIMSLSLSAKVHKEGRCFYEWPDVSGDLTRNWHWYKNFIFFVCMVWIAIWLSISLPLSICTRTCTIDLHVQSGYHYTNKVTYSDS